MAKADSQHRWRFFRAGGLDQVRFHTAEDYRRLKDLDQKLWVALACPVRGLELDERTLALIDSDGDGRVRAPEVIAAVQWMDDRIKDLAALKDGSDVLPLDLINEATPAGAGLLSAARHVLAIQGQPDATSISLADVSDPERIFSQAEFNGDGIITVNAAEDDLERAAIEAIIETHGGDIDRTGRPGVSQEKVDAFFAELDAYVAWEAEGRNGDGALRPLGDDTPAAADALRAVRAKVEDYFGRTRLAAYDPRALTALNRKEEEYFEVAARDMDVTMEEVSGFPLARIEADRPLPLQGGINPAWARHIAALREKVVAPLLGADRDSLTEDEWRSINDRFAPYEAWLARRPGTKIETLGAERVQALQAPGLRARLTDLIARDKALEAEANAVGDLERMVRYYRDLHRLLTNFVNFADFYDQKRAATFQIGVLYLDARSCRLCVRVEDAAKHAELAGLAKTYLAYCECARKGGEKMTVAVAFTNGDSDNLMVGRNGIFYDSRGNDWDATITKIIENPMSIRQAFWAPYKKLVRLIEEQVAKRAAAAESEADRRLTSAAETTANLDKSKPAPPKKLDTGTVAALGVALGFLASAFSAILGHAIGLFSIPFWQVVLAFAGLLLVISGPSMLIAWLKLRQRNLGPILDASGWAVNGRVKVPVPLGRELTQVAKLPPGTIPSMDDRFAEPPRVWPAVLGTLLAVAFLLSLLNDYGLLYKWTGYGTNRGLVPRKSLLDLIPTNETNAPAANAPDTDALPAAPAEEEAAPAEGAPAPEG